MSKVINKRGQVQIGTISLPPHLHDFLVERKKKKNLFHNQTIIDALELLKETEDNGTSTKTKENNQT